MLEAIDVGLVTSEIRLSGFAVPCNMSIGSGIPVISFGNNEDVSCHCHVLFFEEDRKKVLSLCRLRKSNRLVRRYGRFLARGKNFPA